MSDRRHIHLDGIYPAAVSDSALCRDCDWFTNYSHQNGQWRSKTLALAKSHVRSTGHKVAYRQNRFSLIKLTDPE